MRSWTLLLLLCCLLVPATAAADDGSLGRSGETVFPMGEPTVRMEAEEVLLRIDPERTAVSLSFTFANSGPAKQVLMGFPLQQKFEGRGHPELNEFTTRVDGTAVPVVTEKASAGEYPGWITWPVAFGANQTVTVTNSYWGTNTYWSNGDTLAGYILKTGAVWNGTIGRARVRAKLAGLLPVDLQGIVPADYHWDGDDLVWEWRDFEPTRDIALRWNLRVWQYPVLPFLTTPALSFPPGPSAADLTAARKASPNTSGKPDALDLALLRMADQKGDHAAVKAGVQEAMAAGVKEPLIAYLAVKEGVLKPADVLGWELGPALLRWVQDRAGLEGAPPAVPVLRREGYYVGVALADPDGDIADWGLKVWLQPNESLTPILAAPGHDEWQYYNERSFDRLLEAPQEAVGSEVWARAWVVDGRGHRQETGLVRLAGPEAPAVAAPEPVLVADPDPTPAAPATPSPSEVRRANPLGWYLLGAFALIAAGAAAFRRLRK